MRFFSLWWDFHPNFTFVFLLRHLLYKSTTTKIERYISHASRCLSVDAKQQLKYAGLVYKIFLAPGEPAVELTGRSLLPALTAEPSEQRPVYASHNMHEVRNTAQSAVPVLLQCLNGQFSRANILKTDDAT